MGSISSIVARGRLRIAGPTVFTQLIVAASPHPRLSAAAAVVMARDSRTFGPKLMAVLADFSANREHKKSAPQWLSRTADRFSRELKPLAVFLACPASPHNGEPRR